MPSEINISTKQTKKVSNNSTPKALKIKIKTNQLKSKADQTNKISVT